MKTYRLKVTISHPSFSEPMNKTFYYSGDTLSDVLDQIDTPQYHKDNLGNYRKTAFKDVHDVKHEWVLEEMKFSTEGNTSLN